MSEYYNNRKIRNKIDGYLKRNVSVWANLGTKGKLDVGTKKKARFIWSALLKKIKQLDPVFWNAIRRDND